MVRHFRKGGFTFGVATASFTGEHFFYEAVAGLGDFGGLVAPEFQHRIIGDEAKGYPALEWVIRIAKEVLCSWQAVAFECINNQI